MNQPYKWVGSKRRYLPIIRALMPPSYGTYYEPFFGGGALFFDLEPRQAVVSDLSRDNINFIKALGGATCNLIDQVRELAGVYNGVSEEDKSRLFEAARTAYNARNRAGWGFIHVGQATGFYGLLTGGFNGLWRLNRKGELNTPFGGDRQIPFDAAALTQAGRLLSHTVIRHCDFEVTMRDAAAGDFVFLDPPYLDQFDSYTGNKFGVGEHYRLYRAVEDARKRGAMVMVTTNDHPHLRNLYKGYRIEGMDRMQSISQDGKGRGKVKDIVIMGGY